MSENQILICAFIVMGICVLVEARLPVETKWRRPLNITSNICLVIILIIFWPQNCDADPPDFNPFRND